MEQFIVKYNIKVEVGDTLSKKTTNHIRIHNQTIMEEKIGSGRPNSSVWQPGRPGLLDKDFPMGKYAAVHLEPDSSKVVEVRGTLVSWREHTWLHFGLHNDGYEGCEGNG